MYLDYTMKVLIVHLVYTDFCNKDIAKRIIFHQISSIARDIAELPATGILTALIFHLVRANQV
jgi:hypothetical protein